MAPSTETERRSAILDELLRRLSGARSLMDVNIAAGIAQQELEGVTED